MGPDTAYELILCDSQAFLSCPPTALSKEFYWVILKHVFLFSTWKACLILIKEMFSTSAIMWHSNIFMSKNLPVCVQSNVPVLWSLRMLIAILKNIIDEKQHLTHLHISPLERKIVPSFSQSSVPSLPASLATVESKLSVPQSPPPSPVKSSLEVRLYPQPYFQARMQHQAQQLKKIEPPLQSPIKLKPKVVSTALVRFIHQCFHLLLTETVKVSWLQSAHSVEAQQGDTWGVCTETEWYSTYSRIHVHDLAFVYSSLSWFQLG